MPPRGFLSTGRRTDVWLPTHLAHEVKAMTEQVRAAHFGGHFVTMLEAGIEPADPPVTCMSRRESPGSTWLSRPRLTLSPRTCIDFLRRLIGAELV